MVGILSIIKPTFRLRIVKLIPVKKLSAGNVITVMFVLVVLSVVLFPVFATAPVNRRSSHLFSAPRQIATSIQIYMSDYDERLPDRRDVKRHFEYAPWLGFPLTDPRSGWAVQVFAPYSKNNEIWDVSIPEKVNDVRIRQGNSTVWMWGFDQVSDNISKDDYWGKTIDSLLIDLQDNKSLKFQKPKDYTEIELITNPHSFEKFTPLASLPEKYVTANKRRIICYIDGHVKANKP
jgi:hypothetical protein